MPRGIPDPDERAIPGPAQDDKPHTPDVVIPHEAK
jgi:hypothetical protein